MIHLSSLYRQTSTFPSIHLRNALVSVKHSHSTNTRSFCLDVFRWPSCHARVTFGSHLHLHLHPIRSAHVRRHLLYLASLRLPTTMRRDRGHRPSRGSRFSRPLVQWILPCPALYNHCISLGRTALCRQLRADSCSSRRTEEQILLHTLQHSSL